MRYKTIILLLSVLSILPFQAMALPPLYEAEAEVPDQGAGARTEGMREALTAVLVKVSGSSHIAEEAALADALQQPARYVQQYSYRREDKEGGGRLLLHVRFDPRGVDALLRQSGLSAWGDARPSTLIWLGVEDGGRRVLVGNNDRGLVRDIIEREAARRALPVKLPALDQTDQARVRPADVWGEFLETIKGASQRYSPNAILVGRIYPVSAARWEARWVLEYRGETSRWQSSSAEVAPLIAEGVDRVTDYLVSHIAQSFVSGSDEVLMRVEGVRNLREYRRVINYLRSTQGVKQVLVETVNPDMVRLYIVAEGGFESVLQQIALGKILTKVSQPVAPSLPQNQRPQANAERDAGKYSFGTNDREPSPAAFESAQPELVYRLMP